MACIVSGDSTKVSVKLLPSLQRAHGYVDGMAPGKTMKSEYQTVGELHVTMFVAGRGSKVEQMTARSPGRTNFSKWGRA